MIVDKISAVLGAKFIFSGRLFRKKKKKKKKKGLLYEKGV